MLMLSPGTNTLCEVALRIGTRFCPAGGGAGRSHSTDCVGNGSRHAGGSVPQGWAQYLPFLPHPGRRTPSTSAPEVRPDPSGPRRLWKRLTIILGRVRLLSLHPGLPPQRKVAMSFGVRAQPSNISHRSQRSVPEEFSAPLELSQPLSGLMDGSISLPSPALHSRCP